MADKSRPQGFLDRQVDRWLGQLDSYRVRDLPGIDDLASWLRANLPQHGDLTVMHGDYKLDNVICAPTAPPHIACVVDFEMTTVVDPLIDLAWAMIFWPEDGNPIALATPGTPYGIHPDHCQTPAQLVDRYAAATGDSREHVETMLGSLTGLLENGAIRDTVQEQFAFDEVPAALARVAQRKALGGSAFSTRLAEHGTQSRARPQQSTAPASGGRRGILRAGRP